MLFGALVLVLGLKDVSVNHVPSPRQRSNDATLQQLIPFIYVQHPRLSLSTTLGFLQLTLSFLLLLTLLLTPPHFTPLHPTSTPNPAQLASPLSRLLFSWNETRMWSWYRRSGKAADHEFLEFVPPLPDYLGAGWVLGLFRWKGDEVRAESEVREESEGSDVEETPSGAVKEFIWTFRWELLKILGFAVVWIVAIFVSPLSMNLVRRSQCSGCFLLLTPRSFTASLLRSGPCHHSRFSLPLRPRHLPRTHRLFGRLPERCLSPGANRVEAEGAVGTCGI